MFTKSKTVADCVSDSTCGWTSWHVDVNRNDAVAAPHNLVERGKGVKSLIWKLKKIALHSEESLFPNICRLPLLLFFWLKWAGYLAVADLNLLAQNFDRISPDGV